MRDLFSIFTIEWNSLSQASLRPIQELTQEASKLPKEVKEEAKALVKVIADIHTQGFEAKNKKDVAFATMAHEHYDKLVAKQKAWRESGKHQQATELGRFLDSAKTSLSVLGLASLKEFRTKIEAGAFQTLPPGARPSPLAKLAQDARSYLQTAASIYPTRGRLTSLEFSPQSLSTYLQRMQGNLFAKQALLEHLNAWLETGNNNEKAIARRLIEMIKETEPDAGNTTQALEEVSKLNFQIQPSTLNKLISDNIVPLIPQFAFLQEKQDFDLNRQGIFLAAQVLHQHFSTHETLEPALGAVNGQVDRLSPLLAQKGVLNRLYSRNDKDEKSLDPARAQHVFQHELSEEQRTAVMTAIGSSLANLNDMIQEMEVALLPVLAAQNPYKDAAGIPTAVEDSKNISQEYNAHYLANQLYQGYTSMRRELEELRQAITS